MRSPTKEDCVKWVKTAWSSVSMETIQSSFKCASITTSVDGKEDMLVTCLAENPRLAEEVQLNLYATSNMLRKHSAVRVIRWNRKLIQPLPCLKILTGTLTRTACRKRTAWCFRGGAASDCVMCFRCEILSYHITFSLGNVSSIQLSVWSLQICWKN